MLPFNQVEGGFFEGDWQLCHMRRSKVAASLHGWQPVQSDLSGDHFGISEETADTPRGSLSQNSNQEGCDDGEMEVFPLVDLSSSRVQPLPNKNLRDFLSYVSLYYDNCKDEVKFVVGAMSVKLKHLVFD